MHQPDNTTNITHELKTSAALNSYNGVLYVGKACGGGREAIKALKQSEEGDRGTGTRSLAQQLRHWGAVADKGFYPPIRLLGGMVFEMFCDQVE